MWHEARKQERRIRGMIVDYRKRAERRQDFYERIQADPTQFIQIHGRRCKIHLDPAIAAAGDGTNIIVPWQGQQEVLIDRFDVRAHLDYIPPILESTTDAEEELSLEERQSNYERYRILAQNDFLSISEEKFLHQLYLEEQFGASAAVESISGCAGNKKKQQKSSGVSIGYSYEETGDVMALNQTVVNEQGKKKSERDSESESESDIDMDVSIDVSKLDTAQAHELNGFGRNYGMLTNDFYSYLTKDADEAEAMRLAREEEQKKMLLSGRKSRRERRAQTERRIASRPFSPPSYAARDDITEEKKDEESAESRSPSPIDMNTGKITYITSFGGEDELQPHSKITISLTKGATQTLGEACVKTSTEVSDKIMDKSSHRRSPFSKNRKRRTRSGSRSRHRSRSFSPGYERRSRRSDYYYKNKSRRTRSRSRKRDGYDHKRRRRRSSRNRSSSDSYSNKYSAYKGRNSQSNTKTEKLNSRSRSRSHQLLNTRTNHQPVERIETPFVPTVGESNTANLVNTLYTASIEPTTVKPLTSQQCQETSANLFIVEQPPPPPLKRYYGRKREDDDSSSLASSDSNSETNLKVTEAGCNDDEIDTDDHMDVDTTSERSNPLPSTSMMGQCAANKKSSLTYSAAVAKTPGFSIATETKAALLSTSAAPGGRLNLRERLKRKMQSLLNKQYKADKKAEIEKTEREKQLQQEREDEMRELALKLRRRQRELRHKYGTPSSDKNSNSENSELGSKSYKDQHQDNSSSKGRCSKSKSKEYSESRSNKRRSKSRGRRESRVSGYSRRSRSRRRSASRRRSSSRRRSVSRKSHKSPSESRYHRRYRNREKRDHSKSRDERNRCDDTTDKYHRKRRSQERQHDRDRCGESERRHRGEAHSRSTSDYKRVNPETARSGSGSGSNRNRVVISAPPKLKKLVDY